MKKNFETNANMILIKIIVVAVLVVIMLIPITLIRSLIEERQGNKDAEQTEMGWKWGGKQQVAGPVLAISYRDTAAKISDIRTAYFMPDEYIVNGDIKPEERTRGIQKILNYQANMNVSGQFSFPDIEKLGISESQVLWDESYLMMGIPNLQGIKNKIVFNVNGKPYDVMPSVPSHELINSGLAVKISLDNQTKEITKFNFDLILNGTEGLYFIPVGKHTDIHLASTWQSVEYTGDFVAAEKADVKDGIDARWDIFDYNRNFTQMWIGENPNFEQSKIGVDLKLPINHYEKTLRAVKYAIMFIVLTFIVFFLVEMLSKKKIHPVQYLLVSSALILFYTLLLAISEHLGFGLSYLISAFATTALITAYSSTIFKNAKQTAMMGIFLTALYLYLYIVLQLEDMALLFGAIGLFVTLATVMYVLRKVEWYKDSKDNKVEIIEVVEDENDTLSSDMPKDDN